MDNSLYKLSEIKRSIKQPKKLSELWVLAPLLWDKLGWKQSQLRLWLAVIPGIKIKKDQENKNPTYQLSVQEEKADLAELVYEEVSNSRSAIAIAQIKNQMPKNMLVTDAMIQAVVKAHPKLLQIGPLVKLK